VGISLGYKLNKNMKSIALPLTALALAIVLLAGVLLFKPFTQAIGATFPGTSASLQIATTTVLGPQGAGVVRNRVFVENLECKSRVITTPGTSGIMLSFDDISFPVAGTTTPSGVVGSTTIGASLGHYQAPSTTVAYDAGIYGCGVWNGWAWASTTITTSEF